MARTARLAAAVVVLLSAARSAWGVPTIIAGHHTLMPDTPGQRVPIMVTGGDPVMGVDLFLQVGDGGYVVSPNPNDVFNFGQDVGPVITDVDLYTDTIFAGNYNDRDQGPQPPLLAFRSTTTAEDTVSAEGLLATVVFDTTGMTEGTIPFSLIVDLHGFDAAFRPDRLPNAIRAESEFPGVPTRLMDGALTILAIGSSEASVPEPDGLWIIAIAGLVLTSWYRGARVKRHAPHYLRALAVRLAALAAIYFTHVQPAAALPTIIAGNHTLLPNTTGQRVPIMVTGGDPVMGVDLYLQVGDGGYVPDPTRYNFIFNYGKDIGPRITGVDLVDSTIFANNYIEYPSIDSPPLLAFAAAVSVHGTVLADGLLATITLDTTGMESGTFPLRLTWETFGWDMWPTHEIIRSDFALIDAVLVDGTLTIQGPQSVAGANAPEPATAPMLITALTIVGLICAARKRPSLGRLKCLRAAAN